MKPYTATIKGAPWTITKLSTKAYTKKHGSGSEGMCVRDEKLIDIDTRWFTVATSIHEITHAFVSECYGHMIDLTADQTEELMCEIFSHHGEEILSYANKVVAHYKGK